MDELHLHAAFRYVALNPVRAGLVWLPEEWRWSSVRAHYGGRDDHVVRVAPALERVGDFRAFLSGAVDEPASYAALRKAEGLGRPLGARDWLVEMEARTGLPLIP